MTTSDRTPEHVAGPPTADDLRAVNFTPASMLHPGYTDREVDDVVGRAADELARLTAEDAARRAGPPERAGGGGGAPPPLPQRPGRRHPRHRAAHRRSVRRRGRGLQPA